MKYFVQLLLIVVLLAVLVTTAYAGQDKVTVCHITGTYDFGAGIEEPYGHIITIADPAYQSHIDHGDPEAYEPAIKDGNEVCKPAVISPLQTP
jgi:hypothetical protein